MDQCSQISRAPRRNALWAPACTPKDIIAKLNAGVVNALADPVVVSRFGDIGPEIFPREQQTPGLNRRLTILVQGSRTCVKNCEA